jgi:hypothetical protein
MNNNNWIKSIAKSYVQLDEARKMKPTSTDVASNKKIESAAKQAHLIAANAISSVPGAKALKEYPGQMVYGDEDPEHISVLAHLADVAKTVTDPKEAIKMVAQKHGVNPEAAIAAIPSSAPMGVKEFLSKMARK